MKKLLSLMLTLIMATALAVPAFAIPADPPEFTDTDDGIIPSFTSFTLFADTAIVQKGGYWGSYEFAATPSHGNYIRYWHQNNTNEDVKVYLYRTDSDDTTLVSMMYVKANDQNSEVYYIPTAGFGIYKIVVEAYVSGGSISGDVVVSQYKTNPETIDTDHVNEIAIGRGRGPWTLYEYTAIPSHGNYIRYWHQNNTNEDVRVYLYRTDSNDTTYVSMMNVKANDQNSEVYYTPTAGSGTYKIDIEACVPGGSTSGDVAIAQYPANPG